LSSLDDPFSEEEVRCAINQMPSDKAPGPDGFIGAFFKICCVIIKEDVMKAITFFRNLHVASFHWLNSANIALLPKKGGPKDISNFRPISLIHGIAKIVTEMLSTRLGSFMDELVSTSRSTFIKKRSTEDNFLYVKNLAKGLHKNKCRPLFSSSTSPRLLIRLDGSTF
jgi:hypothetical protein